MCPVRTRPVVRLNKETENERRCGFTDPPKRKSDGTTSISGVFQSDLKGLVVVRRKGSSRCAEIPRNSNSTVGAFSFAVLAQDKTCSVDTITSGVRTYLDNCI